MVILALWLVHQQHIPVEEFVLVNPEWNAFEIISIDCFTLDPLCTSCANSTLCYSCSGGTFAYKDTCLLTCPVDTYEENGVCIGHYLI